MPDGAWTVSATAGESLSLACCARHEFGPDLSLSLFGGPRAVDRTRRERSRHTRRALRHAIVTRQGGDVSPERGKGGRLRVGAESPRKRGEGGRRARSRAQRGRCPKTGRKNCSDIQISGSPRDQPARLLYPRLSAGSAACPAAGAPSVTAMGRLYKAAIGPLTLRRCARRDCAGSGSAGSRAMRRVSAVLRHGIVTEGGDGPDRRGATAPAPAKASPRRGLEPGRPATAGRDARPRLVTVNPRAGEHQCARGARFHRARPCRRMLCCLMKRRRIALALMGRSLAMQMPPWARPRSSTSSIS